MKRERITKQELETMRRIYRNGELPARILAEEIGVSENVFYRWMSGDRNPGYLVTARIRQFLKKHTFSDHADRLRTIDIDSADAAGRLIAERIKGA